MDFLCTLATAKGKLVYPENAFYVQVKSNVRDFHLNADSISWMMKHMEIPLYVCVVNKDKDSLSFYSTSVLWKLFFITTNITGVAVKLSKQAAVAIRDIRNDKKRAYKAIQYEVNLGEPFMIKTIAELESDKKEEMAYKIMKARVAIDGQNIVNKNMGGLSSVHASDEWKINAVHTETFIQFNDRNDYRMAEGLIVKQLTPLAMCYLRSMRAPNISIHDKDKLRSKFNRLIAYINFVDPDQLFFIRAAMEHIANTSASTDQQG